jgi:hypothetical protein
MIVATFQYNEILISFLIQMGIKVENNIVIGADGEIGDLKLGVDIVQINSGGDCKSFLGSYSDTITSLSAEQESKLTTISSYSFYQCVNLRAVDLSNCNVLKQIGLYSFAYCSSLSSLVLPTNIQEILGSSFRSTKLNQTINIHKATSFTGESFLYSNTSFEVDEDNSKYAFYENNIYSKSFDVLIAVSFSTKVLKLHHETKTIGYCCFSSSSLESIYIPPTTEAFQTHTFHCARFTKHIVIESQITEFPKDCLLEVPSIVSLWLPDSLVNLKANSFNLPSLISIRVSDSIEVAEQNTFVGCNNVRYVYSLDNHKRNVLINSGIPRRALFPFIETQRKCTISKLYFGFFVTFIENAK